MKYLVTRLGDGDALEPLTTCSGVRYIEPSKVCVYTLPSKVKLLYHTR
jgi:hypothetical protein